MIIEYKIILKKPDGKYWGEFSETFQNYTDAVTGLEKIMKENGSGTYRIIRTTSISEIAEEKKVM